MATPTDASGNELFTIDNPATLTITEGGTGMKRKTSGTTLTTSDGFELFSADNPAYVQIVGQSGGAGGDAQAREVFAGVVGTPLTKDDSVEQQRIKLQAIKKKLADNLTTKGVVSTDSEALDTLAGKVVTINGKRRLISTVATAQDCPSNRTASFLEASNEVVRAQPYFEYANLGWKPRTIVLTSMPGTLFNMATYLNRTDTQPFPSQNPPEIVAVAQVGISQSSATASNTFKANKGSCVVTDTMIRLPLPTAGTYFYEFYE